MKDESRINKSVRVLAVVVNSIAMLIMPWMEFAYILSHKTMTLYFAVCIAMGVVNLLMILFCELKNVLTPAIHTTLLCVNLVITGFFAGVFLYLTNECESVITVYALCSVAGAVAGFAVMLAKKVKNKIAKQN